jgi:predicted transcriptional regulator
MFICVGDYYSNVAHMEATQKAIAKTMLKDNVIGKKHRTTDTLKHCVARHDRGHINKALKALVKQGLIIQHTTEHGTSYRLDPRKVAEIKKILGL